MTNPINELRPVRKIAVIMNPVAGLKDESLKSIREYIDALPATNTTYYETAGKDDAKKFAQQAAADGTHLVVAYGGDGTMTEVAAGLMGSGIPLGMLPGGTANVMAIELGVPVALSAALDLIFKHPNQPRQVDMGKIDGQLFILRAGIGYEAQISATAPRTAKRERGRLAYFQHAFSLIRRLRRARYIITVDGEQHVVKGITCMVCNSTNVGLNNLQLVHLSSVSDGVLDVVVIEGLGVRSMLRILLSIFQGVLPWRTKTRPALHHWQGKSITIDIRPRQLVAFDGEKLKYARRVSVVVVPNAVNIIVPAR